MKDTSPTLGSNDPQPPTSTVPVTPTATADTKNTLQTTSNPGVLLDVVQSVTTELMFPVPTPDSLASFLYSNFIIPKLTENKSFFLCQNQFFHQYYHPHLVTFFQLNIGTTCLTFSQLDTLIVTALQLLGFD